MKIIIVKADGRVKGMIGTELVKNKKTKLKRCCKVYVMVIK